ncbi:MAG: FKBP-type peptidyl-prolyl cis-trans isomerase [Oceanospirillaceae bacterium]|nr:FKBP-type peptidyl-prolyl cis-trans isomerase [Oceanospirillaceae bacterium]
MQINTNCEVSFHYALIDAKGAVIESSREADAPTFTTGQKQIIAGLEAGMLGKSPGDKFQLKIKADQGYGLWSEDKVFDIEAGMFSDIENLEVGLVCNVTTPEGEDELVCVVAINEDLVTVDANHRFAGVDLKFSIEIMAVKAVSA